MRRPAPSGDRLPAIAHAAPDLQRGLEDRPDAPGPALYLGRADRLEAGRRDAAALRAIGIAAELARGDAVLEVGRDARRGLREDALLGALRGRHVVLDQPLGHLDLLVLAAQRHQRRDDTL